MKKILFFCILVYSLFGITYADNVDFLAKKYSAGDETFSHILEDISLHTPITFQVTTLGNNTEKNFNINFSTGFTFEGYSQSGNCNFSLLGSTANNFVYNFSGSSICISQIQFIYKPIATGKKNIDLIYNNSIHKSIEIQINSDNSIIKAQTKDSNQNGYIDGYDVEFAFSISNINNIGGLTIGGLPALSYSGNTQTGTIIFQDNIFHSGDIPQILSSGNIFENVKKISNNSIIEEDNAGAVLTKINSIVATGSLFIQNGNIDFEFSEFLHPNSVSFFQLKQNSTPITGNMTLSGNIVSFQPSSTLSVGNYLFESFTGAKDYSSNANKIGGFPKTLILTGNVLGNCTGLPINALWNSVSSIFRYWDGNSFNPSSLTGVYHTSASATECRFICKSGYNWNGSNCISTTSSSGGGGGGGGGGAPANCTDSMLECNSYLGGYIYFRKTGINCSGGNLGKTCTPQTVTSSGNIITQTGGTQSGSNTGTQDNPIGGGNTINISNLDEIKNSLLTLTKNQKIITIILQMYNEISGIKNDFYQKVSPVWRENYNNLLATYKLYITHLNNYVLYRNINDFTQLTPTYNTYKNYIEVLKYPESIYIDKVWKNGFLIYETKNEKLKPVLAKIETILFKKYNSLLARKKISQDTYYTTINNYNQFILYLTIFRDSKNKESKEKGKYYLSEILKIYQIK